MEFRLRRLCPRSDEPLGSEARYFKYLSRYCKPSDALELCPAQPGLPGVSDDAWAALLRSSDEYRHRTRES
eukprot:2902871-Rhodomonas_salina.1